MTMGQRILIPPREAAVAAGHCLYPGREDEENVGFCVRWTEHSMSCPLRKREGSGYVKPTDSALAKANEEALAKLRAERAAQDARLVAAWGPTEEKKETKSTTTAPPQRYKMTGD